LDAASDERESQLSDSGCYWIPIILTIKLISLLPASSSSVIDISGGMGIEYEYRMRK
jgi:hypothetical protein